MLKNYWFNPIVIFEIPYNKLIIILGVLVVSIINVENICIRPLGEVADEMLQYLTNELSLIFGRDVISLASIPIPSQSYDVKRRQCLSTELLKTLLSTSPVDASPPEADLPMAPVPGSRSENPSGFVEQGSKKRTASDKILGITEVDIFIPIFTYIFGEAQLGGRAALISIARLRPQHYEESPPPEAGLPMAQGSNKKTASEDEELYKMRILKEAVHELGHTFGLTHCVEPKCIMRFANNIVEVDSKDCYFCSSCADLIMVKENPNHEGTKTLK